ncbi:class I SAM-dependent methyltransferase [Caminibacter sp.]
MIIEFIKNKKTSKEFKRLYHGRGEKTFPFLTIDSVDEILFVQFYEKVDEKPFLDELKKYINHTRHKHIIVKRRYSNETFALIGEIPQNAYAIEKGIKFKLNFYNQNIGYFGDISPLRKYVESISNEKSVLNLFSYTCGFSMFAKTGGAKTVVNIDMNKSVLKIGMQNHQINNLSLKNISFLQHNVLKSNYKKQNYDIIIIDPPSFQKGGFIIEENYPKLIQKIAKYTNENSILIATLNSPKFDKEYLKNLVEDNSDFRFFNEIPPNEDYVNSTLKCLVFTY